MSFPVFSHAKSIALRYKLKLLSSSLFVSSTFPFSGLLSSFPEDYGNAPQEAKTSAAIHKAGQIRLWRMMQHGLYDHSAARRLKPLRLRDNHESSAIYVSSDEMLQEQLDVSNLGFEMLAADETYGTL